MAPPVASLPPPPGPSHSRRDPQPPPGSPLGAWRHLQRPPWLILAVGLVLACNAAWLASRGAASRRGPRRAGWTRLIGGEGLGRIETGTGDRAQDCGERYADLVEGGPARRGLAAKAGCPPLEY
eukprot:evm.model.scf_263.12 EVM.evm.TU.scf_263.12   scf_263:92491-92861(-)